MKIINPATQKFPKQLKNIKERKMTKIYITYLLHPREREENYLKE